MSLVSRRPSPASAKVTVIAGEIVCPGWRAKSVDLLRLRLRCVFSAAVQEVRKDG